MEFSEEIARMDRAAQQRLGRVEVVYTPLEGDAVTVPGLFDDTYTLIHPRESSVEQTAPAVWLMLADLPVDPETDEPLIQIGSTYYRVRERQTDGFGKTVRLLLHVTEAPVS